jgi:uncharacterized membrane protein
MDGYGLCSSSIGCTPITSRSRSLFHHTLKPFGGVSSCLCLLHMTLIIWKMQILSPALPLFYFVDAFSLIIFFFVVCSSIGLFLFLTAFHDWVRKVVNGYGLSSVRFQYMLPYPVVSWRLAFGNRYCSLILIVFGSKLF